MRKKFIFCRLAAGKKSTVKCGVNCGVIMTVRYPPIKLIAPAVKNLYRSGGHTGGNGFYLVNETNGARRWMQRLLLAGERYDIGLSGVRSAPLDEVREIDLRNKRIKRAENITPHPSKPSQKDR